MMNETYELIIEGDKLYWTTLLDDKNIMDWKSFLSLAIFLTTTAQAQWAEKSDKPLLMMKMNPNFHNSSEQMKRSTDPLSKTNAPKLHFKIDDNNDIFQATNLVNPCLKTVDQSLGNKPFLSLYDVSSKASNLFCMETMSFDRNPYSKEYCENVSSCAFNKLQEIPTGAEVGLYIQQVLSEDYIQSELKANIVDMVRFENLMKYMDKKYPGSAKMKCESRFVDPSLEKSCIYSINNHFMKMQKDCKMPQEFCYAASSTMGQGFIEFEEENRGGSYSNAFSQFFTQRTDRMVEKKSEEEDAATTELLKILTGKDSDKVKEEKFYAALATPFASGKFDPITGFFLTNDKFTNQKEEVKRRFGKFVSAALKDNKSLDKLKKDYDSFRLELGYSLVNENCNNVPTYDSICVNSEIIYAGTSERKVSADRAQTVLKRSEDYGDRDSERIQSIIKFFPKETDDTVLKNISKKEVAKVLLENARCNTFDFDSVHKKESILYNMTNGVPDYMKLQQNPEFVKMMRLPEGSVVIDSRTRIQQARARIKEFKEKLERESEEKTRRREGRDSSGDHEFAKFEAAQLRNKRAEIPEVTKHVPAVNTSESTVSKINTKEESYSSSDSKYSVQDFSKFNSQTMIQQAPVIPAATQNIIVPQNNVTDETNKENFATNVTTKIEPVKAAAKIAKEPEKEKKAVVSEDNSTIDELKALRNELARLKETSNGPAKAIIAQTPASPESKSFLGAGLTNANETRKEEAESFHAYSSSKSDSGSRSSAGSSSSGGSSSQVSSSSSNNDSSPNRSSGASHSRAEALKLTSGTAGATGSKANDKFALILNTQETTVEQNEQAIVDSILVSNGKTFEIMMDGVAVKVVPVLEKGKLVFEKGKPKYRIFARDDKTSKEAKTVGDLKIQQETEVKRAADRAQYVKLKELTKSALKDK